MAGPTPLASKPVAVFSASDPRIKCPDCGANAWWWRPDGSRICGHCVIHRGCISPNTNGEVTWCQVCVANFWAARERYLATRR